MTATPLPVHGEDDGPGRIRFRAPRNWFVWRRRRPLLAYILAVDLAAVAATVCALFAVPFHRSDLTLGAMILACTVLYIEASRPIERVRERSGKSPHIEINSTFTFAAVVLVHPALVTLVVMVVFVHRWIRVRHHVVHRQTFSAAACVISSYAAIAVLALGGHYRGFADMPRDALTLLTIAAAGLTYVGVNTVLICAAVAMTKKNPTLRTVTADWEDYALEVATIALAVLVAWALVDWREILALILFVAWVLHREVLMPQLRIAASTDAKTGLLNHAAWTTATKHELLKAQRAQHAEYTLAVLMLDLDKFKQINDQHGHFTGDDVLARVARTIAAAVRSSDLVTQLKPATNPATNSNLGKNLVGRFGGEEFVVVLPGANWKHALEVAERIRQQIAGLDIPSDDAYIHVTTSIGVAVYPTHATTHDELMKAADKALMLAKDSGRNTVCLPPIPTT